MDILITRIDPATSCIVIAYTDKYATETSTIYKLFVKIEKMNNFSLKKAINLLFNRIETIAVYKIPMQYRLNCI